MYCILNIVIYSPFQGISNVNEEAKSSLGQVKTLREKVIRAVCRMASPAVNASEVQRHVKNSVIVDIKGNVKQ